MSLVLPANEIERLISLASYDVLDSPNESVFDDLASLAARVAGSEFAAVTLLDAERVWLKARHGRDIGTSGPREHAFCSHAILEPEKPMIVDDLTADPRFQGNPFVDDVGFRSYLGVPLVNMEGHALGTLCVMDYKARPFDVETVNTMKTLARAVVTNFELRRALQQANGAAGTDALTGLANRRTIMQKVDELSQAGTPVVAIAVDLDFFKETNDGEGHAAGDAVLLATAQRLKAAIRNVDMVARLGGDEFVVLLIDVVDRPTALLIAQRICTSLHVPVEFGGKQHRVGATLGLALSPGDVDQGDKVVRVADEALMRAKRERRGSVGIAVDGDAAKLTTSSTILRLFDSCIHSHDVIEGASVHLQPIVTLVRDGSVPAIIAIEALARWEHPTVGNIAPAELFAIIGPERTVQLGQIVRAQALAAFRALREFGLSGARLALNLTAGEVMRADTALNLAEQVETAGLFLNDIRIEITEEVLLERVSNRTLDQLAALRGRGAQLVLDDFGTGNSGLAQLLRLPLDGMKLDKQFVNRAGTDRRAEEIIRATMSLAQSLRLDVVAEGIETEQQASTLHALGCSSAQGYLFGPPMPPDVLKTWLQGRVDPREGVTSLWPRCA